MNPRDMAKIRAQIALQALPPTVEASVIGDGAILSAYQIGAHARSIPLGVETSVTPDALFEALLAAAQGEPVPLVITRNGIPAEAHLRLDSDASAWIQIDSQNVRLPYGALWNPKLDRRREVLTTLLESLSLSAESVRQAHDLIAAADFSTDVFASVTTLLDTAPEEFARRLALQLKSQSQLGENDLLPDDPLYWEQLIPPVRDSKTQQSFIANELAEARSAALNAHPVRYALAMALQFSSSRLVPHELFESLGAEGVFECLKAMSTCNDPYTLAGAFEICARQSAADTRFTSLGDDLLQRLFSDSDGLQRRCSQFGSVFMLATVRLVTHSATRTRPAFWRRLAAAAHASLVVRVMESTGHTFNDSVMETTIQRRGEEYLLSVYLDIPESPRWNPEWIDSRWLMPELFGRIQPMVDALPPEQQRASWNDKLTAATQWVREQKWMPRIVLPSVTEGERLDVSPTLPESFQKQVEAIHQALQSEPTARKFNEFSRAVEMAGVPPDGRETLVRTYEQIVNAGGLDHQSFADLNWSAARMAAILSIPQLADFVATQLVHGYLRSPRDADIFACVLLLLECYGAQRDRDAGLKVLARQLENLAGQLPQGAAATRLQQALVTLQHLDDELASSLATAANLAKLAALPQTLE